jgi:hypothetical protein
MPWVYLQHNGGMLTPLLTYAGQGYSGHALHKNVTESERIPQQGPIPRGLWFKEKAIDHPELGPLAIRLHPAPFTQTWGRAEFWIHGDCKALPGTASHGCIVQPHDTRVKIDASPDDLLLVMGNDHAPRCQPCPTTSGATAKAGSNSPSA